MHPQAGVRVPYLEANPSRAAAIKLYLAIDRRWRSAGARLHSIIAWPWHADRTPRNTLVGADQRPSEIIEPAELLTEPDLATARIIVAERWDTHTHTC
mmetsp:Transcript_61248/g.109250  ORF Transcript_61248/g.109250 Transcript_61248/m.109250 type:complete len:98 (+) Transcript_61248:262-555(+)